MNPAPRALLFDWDNTLVDGWAAIQYALNTTFAAFGKPAWSRQELLANVRQSLRDSFPTHFGDEWERARDIFYEAIHATHLDAVRPLPGTAPMLAAAAPWPLGVVSNKQGALLRQEAAHLELARHFRVLVGAGDAVADKPSAAPLLMALRALDLPPGRDIWYVGDTAIDMEAARAAGCVAVLLGDAAHDGGVTHCAPDMVFADGAALAAHLSALDNPVATRETQFR